MSRSQNATPFPEQHVRVPWVTERPHVALSRESFSFLKLDVICYNDMCEQRLYFDGRQEPPRAVEWR